MEETPRKRGLVSLSLSSSLSLREEFGGSDLDGRSVKRSGGMLVGEGLEGVMAS